MSRLVNTRTTRTNPAVPFLIPPRPRLITQLPALLNTGAVAQALGGIVQTAAGSEVFIGTAAPRLGGLRQVGIGTTGTIGSGTIAQRLGGLRQATTGTEVFTGTAAPRLGGLRQAATGSEVFTGPVTQRLKGLRQVATGSAVFSGVGTQRLGGLRQAQSAQERFTGPLVQRLGGLRQAIVSTLTFAGTGAQRVGGLRQRLVGSDILAGNIGQTVGRLRQSVSGTLIHPPGVIVQHLRGLGQTAVAIAGIRPVAVGSLLISPHRFVVWANPAGVTLVKLGPYNETYALPVRLSLTEATDLALLLLAIAP